MKIKRSYLLRLPLFFACVLAFCVVFVPGVKAQAPDGPSSPPPPDVKRQLARVVAVRDGHLVYQELSQRVRKRVRLNGRYRYVYATDEGEVRVRPLPGDVKDGAYEEGTPVMVELHKDRAGVERIGLVIDVSDNFRITRLLECQRLQEKK